MGGHSTDMLPGSAAGPVKTPYLGYREGEWEGGGVVRLPADGGFMTSSKICFASAGNRAICFVYTVLWIK